MLKLKQQIIHKRHHKLIKLYRIINHSNREYFKLINNFFYEMFLQQRFRWERLVSFFFCRPTVDPFSKQPKFNFYECLNSLEVFCN